MSELKERDARELVINNSAYFPNVENLRVYLKSEADKVIAELKSDYKEACDRLQTANLIKDEQLAATRHQKYKRCLAMADWCALAKQFKDTEWYEKWINKWLDKWLELAEKFKEADDGND